MYILSNHVRPSIHLAYTIIEPRHEISNNVLCATSKASDQPAHTRSLFRAFAQGCGNTMPDLSDLVPFHSGQVGQVQNLYKVNKILYFHILINYYEFTCCIENSVDPNQLASSEAS